MAREGSVWHSTILQLDETAIRAYDRLSPIGQVVHLPGFSPQLTRIPALTELVRQKFPSAVTCKLETCQPYDGQLAQALQANGWLEARPTQYAYTVMLDLTKSPETLTKELKKRARNELNRARNNGVMVIERTPDDEHLELMYQLLTQTASRKQFSVHDKNFTFAYWRNMRQAGMLRLFFAEHEGLILAAAVVLVGYDGKQAWYKEGASTTEQTNINGARYLIWEIAKSLQAEGVKTFDLGGIPDPATYEASSMKGIYIFKTAYTSETVKMMPAYELPISPMRYKLWPKVELILRKNAQRQLGNWYF